MNINDETIQGMVCAYRAAAEKAEQELHAPSREFPDGFYCKDDRDIIATAGMEAAVRVLLPNPSASNSSTG